MKNKYLVIDTGALPDIYEKVILAKDYIKSGQAKDVSEAVKMADVSRSTFYKYKDYVFTVTEGIKGHKVTISILVNHVPGTLSNILNQIAFRKGNILTIYQDIPINHIASINITFDLSTMVVDFETLIDELKAIENVIKLELVAME